ncbi:MAG TPA: hypothetical protein VIO60_04210 [Rectinemataceae bacterium]
MARTGIGLAACLLMPFVAWSCTPRFEDIVFPAGDIRPPGIVGATQDSPETFSILFDEGVRPVEGSFRFSPVDVVPTPICSGERLVVGLSPPVRAGFPCSLTGEVKDSWGNSTRFLFEFAGYNPDPASLILDEAQTSKNQSASNNHRDYVEFLVEEGGELGGLKVEWSSSAKTMAYTFPPCRVSKGEYIVLHLAPESIPAEKDETSSDLALSGGVDSSASGRDFWSSAGGLPDETGVILHRARDGEAPRGGLFYASESKSGPLDSERMKSLVEELQAAGYWGASSPPLWEDAFLWKPSSSRPLYGSGRGGKEAWSVGEPGSQSPGSHKVPQAAREKREKKRTSKGS